jgi:hypothetical protein
MLKKPWEVPSSAIFRDLVEKLLDIGDERAFNSPLMEVLSRDV